MKVNKQELAHVLAALRYCQKYEVNLGIMDHFENGLEPLDDGEVDDLCEALNCGGLEVVDGDPEYLTPKPASDALLAEARVLYADDDIAVDDGAGVSPTKQGTWVQAWVWVKKAG